uniref:ACB domain-containing protein n=1 Tax=Terrapene triunguis TaxID=2587831 RepID=A0A674JDL3_9SAUR
MLENLGSDALGHSLCSCSDGFACVLGSYRPPYEVMLRFYSYYKQATVGSCEIPRPGFWDPIGRYKWDAWNRLGKMSREEAMAAYISEMKKIAQKVQTWGIGRVAGLG